jgi:hypothetical protein
MKKYSDVSEVLAMIALMMETARISETSVNGHQTSWRNKPEDSHLHIRRLENPKSHLYAPSSKLLTRFKKCVLLVTKTKILFGNSNFDPYRSIITHFPHQTQT